MFSGSIRKVRSPSPFWIKNRYLKSIVNVTKFPYLHIEDVAHDVITELVKFPFQFIIADLLDDAIAFHFVIGLLQ